MPAKEIVTLVAEQVSITAKSHPTIVKSHLDVELHRDAEHQSDSVELHNRIESWSWKKDRPRLSKYVKRHHPSE